MHARGLVDQKQSVNESYEKNMTVSSMMKNKKKSKSRKKRKKEENFGKRVEEGPVNQMAANQRINKRKKEPNRGEGR